MDADFSNKIFDRWIIAITFLLKFAPRRTDWSVGLKILSLVTILLLTKGIASAHKHVQHKRTLESFFKKVNFRKSDTKVTVKKL